MNTNKESFFHTRSFKLILIIAYLYSFATFDSDEIITVVHLSNTNQTIEESIQEELTHIGVNAIQNLIARAKLFLH